MNYDIALLPGDGIGPEVIQEAVKVLKSVEKRFGHSFNYTEDIVGGISIDIHGTALRPETLEMARQSDAVLFGAVGGPKWDNPSAPVRPEDAILGLRKGLKLYANLRPVKLYPSLIDASPLRPSLLEGVDLLVVRELTGGIYFGRPKKRWATKRGRRSVDTMAYSEAEIERVMRVGFDLARARQGKLTSVDKANVLETSRLWREVAIAVSLEYPDVQIEHLLVDACSMHLIQRPSSFNVIVTGNLFGDILTDEASVLAGSMGLLPSASLGEGRQRRRKGRLGMYEPIHGTAPDIAGRNMANPIGMILSASLMLDYSFGLEHEAQAIQFAVSTVLEQGARTADIVTDNAPWLGTTDMGDRISAMVETRGKQE